MSSERPESSVDGNYISVCEEDDLPEVRPYYTEIDGRGILLCTDGDDVYAVDEICPHESRSMRYGVVQRGRIICPHHQYKFDLGTGATRKRCPPATTFDVEIEDGTVYVRAPWAE